MKPHGTVSRYHSGCRCTYCEGAQRDSASRGGRRRAPRLYDRKAIGEALREICPTGLTDDCPARQQRGSH